MNTTMADGAEQRLDAQIAEALFGQPGMSKMDVANRVRELRGDGPALLVDGQTAPAGQIDAETLWWLQDAINTMAEGGNHSHVRFLQRLHDTLSAHPSPGGQNALVQEALEYFERAGDSGDRVYVEAIREALAVRQPEEVSEGEFRAAASRQTASAESNATAERIIAAARQPVGEAVELARAKVKIAALELQLATYEAPAQAVDLGELREMLVGWKNSDYPLSYEGQCAQRALDACIADLQALIDGKAVGK